MTYSKKKLNLVLGTYNNQPVGTCGSDFEEVYQRAYKSFLQVLYTFPEIPISLHFSGTLLEWLESKHSEYFDVLAEMVKRKQVELVGGGYYAPAFSLIPRPDRVGQIEHLTTYIRKKMGKRPRGGWVCGSIWEPMLTSTFKNCGMEYIFLDEHLFRTASLGNSSIQKACITEDEGKTLYVLPVSKSITRMIPSKSPESMVELLESHADESGRQFLALIDDGANFGFHGDTHETFYKKGWLERFLGLIRDSSVIKTVSPSAYLGDNAPSQRYYFPSMAEQDVLNWTLSPVQRKEQDRILKAISQSKLNPTFLSTGFFRHFLNRYPESNLMYSRMQYTHILVNQVRGDKYRRQSAREFLWRGQCNSAYWHGDSSGIYNNKYRKEIYRSLLKAENTTRVKGVFMPSIINTDFDLDGKNEYLFQSNEINAYVHQTGGTLFELDYLPATWNYLDTLSRYPEVYHTREMASSGYDTYMRKAFIDHFFLDSEKLENFARMRYSELGDFISGDYSVQKIDRDKMMLQLHRRGSLKIVRKTLPLELTKTYTYKRSSLNMNLKIRNLSNTPLETIYGSEINLSFKSPDVKDLRIIINPTEKKKEIPTDPQSSQRVSEVLLLDMQNKVSCSLSAGAPCDLWSMPVSTFVQDRGRIKNLYQSSCFVFRWKLALDPGEEWQVRQSLRFDKKIDKGI